jgi:hypothetical protein
MRAGLPILGVVCAVALTACGSSAASYATSAQVVAALAAHGATCSAAWYWRNGATGGKGRFAECSGVSSGDTSIGVFVNHADAQAWASSMLTGGSSAEVVGTNWAVNTTTGYASKVQSAIGGRILR